MVTYADRPWVKHYDPGVPRSLHPYPDFPMHQFLRDAARKHPHNVVLVTTAKLPVVGRVAAEITYQQLDEQSDALSAALVAQGLQKGDRVAIVMPNCAAFVIAYYAILKAGGVVAATNPTYPADKMQAQIADSGAKIAVVLSLFYRMVNTFRGATAVKSIIVSNIKESLPPLAKTVFTLAKEKKGGHRVDALAAGDHWLQDLVQKHAGQKASVEVHPDDLAIFQYTGGTTGVSKGAMATHAALVANKLQCRAWTGSKGDQDRSHHVFLGAIPFFHVFGLITVVGYAVSIGARIVLVVNPRDTAEVVDIIEKTKPTYFMGVPALYNSIINFPRVKQGKIDLSSVEVCISGSAPLAPSVKREFERLTGGKLMEGFGMSETPTATHTNPFNGENRTGSIGFPLPDVDARIVSLEDGETDMPIGEVGELIISSPNLMVGYHNQPDETAHALRQQQGKTWMFTGDIARMDEDGYFYIVDRRKDMVLVGGFNVYPTNIEKVLTEHPAVLEAGVAGIPHTAKDGQDTIKAWIVLRPGAQATADELKAHCNKRLASYEIPRQFAFIDSLPKTVVGKTLRRELVAMELAEREHQPVPAHIIE